MTKITITQIGIPKEKSNGKMGNYVKAQEYPNKFLSFFCSPETDKFQVGGTYEVDIKENPGMGKNGPTTYYNLSIPKRSNMPQAASNPDQLTQMLKHLLYQELSPLKLQLQKITDHLSGKEPFGMTSDGRGQPNFSPKEPEEDWNMSGLQDDFNNAIDNPRS